MFENTQEQIGDIMKELRASKKRLSVDEMWLKKQIRGHDRNFRMLSQRVAESLKYRQPPVQPGSHSQPPAGDQYIDEATAKEISRALKQSEYQARLDMHQQKLGSILMRNQNGLQSKGRSLEDQVRDAIVNRCRRNGKAATIIVGGKTIKINEYQKAPRQESYY